MSFGRMFPTVAISVTAASKNIAIPVGAAACRITNTSTPVSVYVQFAPAAPPVAIPPADPATGTAVTCVLPNSAAVVDVPMGAAFVGAIGSAAGPSIVNFELGVDA